MDLDRITHPLRLARGSHQPGSGKGCAMNVISCLNGDKQITDFPATSARPLAAFVQSCNDLLAGPDGYLSSENSFIALELGWQTAGTADTADSVIHAWVAELLTSSTWGVVQYAKNGSVATIFDIADLHRTVASGEIPSIAAWDCADRAARAVSVTLADAEMYAVRTAYQSTALVHTEHSATLDAVTGNALRAHELSTEGTGAARIVEVTRDAIRSWRRLAQLDNPGHTDGSLARRHFQRGGSPLVHSVNGFRQNESTVYFEG
jgi:hypothetical protein